MLVPELSRGTSRGLVEDATTHISEAVGLGESLVGEYFSTWSDAAQVALIVTDAAGSIEYANDQCRRLYQRKAGDSIESVFLATELDRLNEALAGLHSDGTPVDTTAHLACGERIARFLICRVADEAGSTRAMICVFRDVTEQGLHERRLEYEVAHDYLTGVLSRAAVIEEIEQHYARRSDSSIALLFVDLDDFKGVNDGFGHLTGDEVLNAVARRLESAIGDENCVARMGGDEFLVVLPGCESEAHALAVAEQVAEALDERIVIGDRTVNQRYSIGVAFDSGVGGESSTDRPGEQVERLLAEADMAMYVAKGDGVSVALADDSTRTWSSQRLVIERDFGDAIGAGELQFHYQPLVELASGKWIGAEALLRWHHPELGLLPPDLVIERAEIIGAVNDITAHTLKTVYQQWADVIATAPVMFHHQISINASAHQLRWPGFVDAHLAALESSGLHPEHVLIEVTESIEIQLHHNTTATLNELVEGGARVSLDDFGVGYSALSYFSQFPIHGLKLDRSLISQLSDSVGLAPRLLAGVVQCAEMLGAVVVAEGIETAEAAERCHDLGIAYGQGWHFERPMPIEAFVPLAREHGMQRHGDKVVLPGDPQVTLTRP